MALLSLRDLLLGKLSLSRRKEPEPKPLRLTGAGSTARIRSAIQQHLPVQFYYRAKTEPGRNGIRVGVPYAIFTRNGVRYLHLYTNPRSVSARRGLPAWRTFILSRCSAVRLPPGSDEQLIRIGALRAPGFNPSWYRRGGSALIVRQPQPKRRT